MCVVLRTNPEGTSLTSTLEPADRHNPDDYEDDEKEEEEEALSARLDEYLRFAPTLSRPLLHHYRRFLEVFN